MPVFTGNIFPFLWKVVEVIMITKPGKPPSIVSSLRPISLLTILSKLLEKLFLNRLIPNILVKKNVTSIIDQIHRVINFIKRGFEEKKVCSEVFLDIAPQFGMA